MARQTVQSEAKGQKLKKKKKKKLPKKFLVGHSWRCANSSSNKCECRCQGLYHGTGIRG